MGCIFFPGQRYTSNVSIFFMPLFGRLVFQGDSFWEKIYNMGVGEDRAGRPFIKRRRTKRKKSAHKTDRVAVDVDSIKDEYFLI